MTRASWCLVLDGEVGTLRANLPHVWSQQTHLKSGFLSFRICKKLHINTPFLHCLRLASCHVVPFLNKIKLKINSFWLPDMSVNYWLFNHLFAVGSQTHQLFYGIANRFLAGIQNPSSEFWVFSQRAKKPLDGRCPGGLLIRSWEGLSCLLLTWRSSDYSELRPHDGAPHRLSEAEPYEGNTFQLLVSGISFQSWSIPGGWHVDRTVNWEICCELCSSVTTRLEKRPYYCRWRADSSRRHSEKGQSDTWVSLIKAKTDPRSKGSIQPLLLRASFRRIGNEWQSEVGP